MCKIQNHYSFNYTTETLQIIAGAMFPLHGRHFLFGEPQRITLLNT